MIEYSAANQKYPLVEAFFRKLTCHEIAIRKMLRCSVKVRYKSQGRYETLKT